MPEDDINKFAQELQAAGDGGQWNPFSFLLGSQHFHSLFLAPFTPALESARRQFLHDASGPFQALIAQSPQPQQTPAEAEAQMREMLHHAQGMCVIVLENDQGLSSIPLLFFGHFDAPYQEYVAACCGENFPDQQHLRSSMRELQAAIQHGAEGYQRFASLEGSPHGRAYWRGLAEGLLQGLDEGLFSQVGERLRDCAHWAAEALSILSAEQEVEGEERLSRSRCHILAQELPQAFEQAAALLSDYEPDEESVLQLLQELLDCANQLGLPESMQQFIKAQADHLDALMGGYYELELLRFRVLTAAQAEQAELLAQAAALAQADRKSYRHDLNREPLWQVTHKEPGPLLTVAQAAERIDRSINFVAKRLEAKTIPFVLTEQGEQMIPAKALFSWQALMTEHRLID